jgi:molybdopterin converting factor small subunit
MEVTLLFFAGARDITQHGSRKLRLPPAIDTASRLLDWLCIEYPGLGPYSDCLRIAQNECFIGAQDQLRDGDVLAVVPPVAGG